jgi:hypothetical protein
MTPDDPELPGRTRGTLPPLSSDRRPLTEYGSAQRILRLFTPAPGTELTAADWEQGPTAREELRKADPALATPLRPLTGHGLGVGHAAPVIAVDASEALADTPEVTPLAPAATPEAEAAAAATAGATAPPAATATTEIPAGAVPGTGTVTCPDGYPIKGNAQSKIYHPPDSRVYAQTVAELCFTTAEAAQAAGFAPPRNL